MPDNRFRRMLERNHTEIRHILKILEIIDSFKDVQYLNLSFEEFSLMALETDLLLRFTRVLEITDDKNNASFWIVLKRAKEEYGFRDGEYSEDLDRLKEMWARVQIVRNKTLIHIDKRYVEDPSKAWEEAKLNLEEIRLDTSKMHVIIDDIWNKTLKESPPCPVY